MVRNRKYPERGRRGVWNFGQISRRIFARGKIRIADLRVEKFRGVFSRKTFRKQKIDKTYMIKCPTFLVIKRKTLDKTAPICYYLY